MIQNKVDPKAKQPILLKQNTLKVEEKMTASGQKKKSDLLEIMEKYISYPSKIRNKKVIIDGYQDGYDGLIDFGAQQTLRELVPLSRLQTLKEKNTVIVHNHYSF